VVAYRDDLEAAQARADALQREVDDLKRRNADLEDEVQRVWEQKPEENPEAIVVHHETPPAIIYPSKLGSGAVPLVATGIALFTMGIFAGPVLAVLGLALAATGAFLLRR